MSDERFNRSNHGTLLAVIIAIFVLSIIGERLA